MIYEIKFSNYYLVLVFLLLMTAAPVVVAKDRLFKSDTRQTNVIELYTSEGCSSCPPADRWVNSLAADKGLWKNFIPLVFHVDYWNYLGWTDPLSSRQYADRQRQYAKTWGKNSVYTPGMVKNGLEWKAWRAGKNIPVAKNAVGMLEVAESKGGFVGEFSPVSTLNEAYEIHAAVLLMGYKSKIKSGENAGETLEHNFSVCSHVSSDAAATGKKFTAQLLVNGCPDFKTEKSVVFWVAKKGTPRPIQAVGGRW